MVDISLIATPPQTASTTAAPSTLTAIQVTIANLSQALEDITHAIQTNATPAAPPAGNLLTLITALGDITVSLPTLPPNEQQNLIQQLTNLAQTQRPLTLALQPATPQATAVLLLPLPPAPAATATNPPLTNAPATNTIAANTITAQPNPLPAPSPTAPPLTRGDTFPALVLPSLTPSPQATMPANLSASHTPMAPTPPLPQPAAPPLAPTISASPPSVAPNILPAAVSAVALTPTPVLQTGAVPKLLPLPTSLTVSTQSAPPPLPVAPAPQTTQPQTQILQPVPPAPLPSSPIIPLSSAQVSASPLMPAATAASPPANFQPPTTPTLTTLLQPGNEITVHIDAVIPPASPNTPTAPAPLPPLAPNQIAATVTGTGTNGQLILKAADATLFIKAQATAPLGSTVILAVEPPKPTALITFPSIEPINFQALPQAIAALAQLDPQTLQQMLSTRIPQPNESLPGAMLFLFNAFKQGNVRSWLGDAPTDNLLHIGKLGIINSLSHELGNAGQAAQDAIVGDWKSYPIPLLVQQQFQALNLYVHHERDARDHQHGQSATGKLRFLIDIRLTKLGAMQIDGFVQPKKLDMILRSESLLPAGMPNDLRTAYIKAVGAVGYTGTLNFQVGRQHWLTMQREAQSGIVT